VGKGVWGRVLYRGGDDAHRAERVGQDVDVDRRQVGVRVRMTVRALGRAPAVTVRMTGCVEKVHTHVCKQGMRGSLQEDLI
jgi:hypothetical protein